MNSLARILKDKCQVGESTVNNDNKSSVLINDINDNNGIDNKKAKKYGLDRSKFIPNTESSQLAEEIATKMNDLKSYACYFDIVNKIGIGRAKQLLASTVQDIQEKSETKQPVRNKGGYLVWKYRNNRY